MEQIICDNSYLLRPATFLEDLSCAFDFFRAFYLFNYSNCSHPSLEVVYQVLCFMAVIHICHLLSFVVTCCTTLYHSLCHSLSFAVTSCHSLSLIVPLTVIRCDLLYHSLPFVGTRCHFFFLILFYFSFTIASKYK